MQESILVSFENEDAEESKLTWEDLISNSQPYLIGAAAGIVVAVLGSLIFRRKKK